MIDVWKTINWTPLGIILRQVSLGMLVTFGRLAVSDFELGVDVIDFDECYCYLFTVLYCDVQFWSILDSVC